MKQKMFFWNSLAFSEIQRIGNLISDSSTFSNPTCTFGSSPWQYICVKIEALTNVYIGIPKRGKSVDSGEAMLFCYKVLFQFRIEGFINKPLVTQ